MPKDKLMTAEEMATHYRKPTVTAFLQAWKRDRLKQQRLIPDPINPGSRDLLWRESDVDRMIAAKRPSER